MSVTNVRMSGNIKNISSPKKCCALDESRVNLEEQNVQIDYEDRVQNEEEQKASI